MRLRPALLAAFALALVARADEGMWTFDNLPLKTLKEKYGFQPSQDWLEHVRLSALSFGGGSGSFVSRDGLAITNHHVGRGWVQSVSGPGEKDFIKHGFLARTRDQELKIPGATLRTLMAMENVTEAVNAAVKPGMSAAQATEARQNALKGLREARGKATGLAYSPVTLYQGGEFWLYGYKVHRDIRLVMAPETGIAAFGGDPDNFTYPRHDLDFTLFRVYEDGKPYQPAHHLTWGTEGVKLGDLTFVVGHPGSTQRLITHAQMLHARDTTLPARLASLETMRQQMKAFAAQSDEHARQVNTRIYGIENSLKALSGYLRGLKDVEALKGIQQREQELQAKVATDPKLQAEAGGSWKAIAQALAQTRDLAFETRYVSARYSSLLPVAVNLVRVIEEGAKPEAQRLKGYRAETELKTMREAALRPLRAGNAELDGFMLRKGLEEVEQALPAAHPFRKALLEGRSAEEAAKALETSKLADPEVRRALIEGGAKALAACEDPIVRVARRIAPMLAAQARRQEAAEATVAEHGARIARARFAVYGKSQYPDATGSLRLTFGPVATYPANGTLQQPFTTFHGLYDRALAWGPEAERGAWSLPQRWVEAKEKVNLSTPFNFVHAVDIIGGNSGSPVLNTKGEFVGIIFDGNIEMLPGNFYYDGKVNRGVTLDARAIREALEKVYDAGFLVDELLGKR